jgi:serine/threonine protein kinase
VSSRAPFGATRQSAAAPEFSLALAGTVIKARYRVNAVASVNRDVVVYSAEDLRHGRPIALKVLRDEFAADAAFVAAVRNQAGALTASAHVLRGVQRVFEFGVTETGQFFIALEWAEGATLREVLGSGGALAEATALRVAILVGEALEALHHDRLFHGHLGLDSVLMVTDGERIRLVGAELAAAYRTPMGLRLGDGFALAYRAPEQMHGGETTAASDVYALGMLLHDLLTSGRTGKAADGAAAPPLSPALERIIANALEARPDRRYPDISVMVNDIWGATAVLPEPESRTRSVKARGNPRRRVRRRRPPFALRITAAAATACVVAAVVWVTGFERIASQLAQLYSRVAPPPVTAVPVHQDSAPAAVAPASVTGSTDQTPARPDVRTVTDEPAAKRPPGTAAPALAPAAERQLPASVVERVRSIGDPRPAAESGASSQIRSLGDPRALEPRRAEPRAAVETKPSIDARRPAESRARGESTTPLAPRTPVEPRARVEPRAAAASQAPVEPRVTSESPAPAERTDRDVGDGSAIIDWLLKDRR